MALQFRRELPSGIVLPTAYGWLTEVSLNLRDGIGQITLDVHPSINEWQRPPAERIEMPLGSPLPSLPRLMADPEFDAIFTMLGAKIYQMVVKHHPDFAEAVEA